MTDAKDPPKDVEEIKKEIQTVKGENKVLRQMAVSFNSETNGIDEWDDDIDNVKHEEPLLKHLQSIKEERKQLKSCLGLD